MKEFISAIEEDEVDQEREAKIAALVEQGKTREEAEAEADDAIAFKVDGRTLYAYRPDESQLIFLMAAMGRGQSNDQRFASIINIMMASLRGDDQDYLETRLLERDPKKKLKPKMIEQIFEYLAGEWFADPTPEQSDSAN